MKFIEFSVQNFGVFSILWNEIGTS